MEKMVQVLAVILPVIFTLGIGMLARRRQILSDRGAADIKSVLMNICIPAVMFKTFYATVFTWRIVVFVLLMLVQTVAAFEIGKRLCPRLGLHHEMSPYLLTSIEGGMMGYALFILLFGDDNLYHMALLDLGNAVILFPVLTTKLRLAHQGGSASARDTLKTLVTPINVAMLAGILVSVSGLGSVISTSGFGSVLNAVLSFLSGPVSMLILLVVGYGLVFSDVPWRDTIVTIAARAVIFAISGVIIYLITGALFPDDMLFRYGVVMGFVLPPSFAYSIYTEGEEENAYVGSVLAIYTILTIIGYCVLAAVAV